MRLPPETMLREPTLDRILSRMAEWFGDLAPVLQRIAAISVLATRLPFRFQQAGWLSEAFAPLIAIVPLGLAALILPPLVSDC